MKIIKLNDYQQKMLEDIINVLTTAATGRFNDENGKKEKVGSSVMVQMPTGTGKTYVMAAVVKLMSSVIGKPLKEAIPGSSFFPMYCDYHAKDENIKIFLLGAKEGVADIAKEKINKRIGREIIVGTYSPPFGFEKGEKECAHIVEMLKTSTANVVLVGLGNPKQTKWIYQYKDQLPNIDVFMALGATIDFEAGNIKRAPKIFQKLALEWFYRFIMEPKRLFKRYFVDDMHFFYYFAKQLLGIYKDPFRKG